MKRLIMLVVILLRQPELHLRLNMGRSLWLRLSTRLRLGLILGLGRSLGVKHGLYLRLRLDQGRSS